MQDKRLPCTPFSDGEIAFYRRFIREPAASKNAMLKTAVERWGFCERHAFGLLTVSASIPRSGLNTAAVLHLHTTANAEMALERQMLGHAGGLHALNNPEPCAMCELGLDEHSPGLIRREWLALSNSLGRLQFLMGSTREYWWPTACPDCGGSAAGIICRRHLVQRFPGKDETVPVRAELEIERNFVQTCRRSLERYLLSFVPDGAAPEPGEGVAALISAAGWCSGWQKILRADDYARLPA